MEAAEIPHQNGEVAAEIPHQHQEEAAEIPHQNPEGAAEIPHQHQEEAVEIPHQSQEEAAEIPPQNPEEAPLAPELDSPKIGPSGFLDLTEFLTLLVGSLYSLGYRISAAKLESSFGTPLESPISLQFLAQILTGQWDACIASIDTINNLSPRSRQMAVFVIRRQCFLELLGSEDPTQQASNVLRDIFSLDVSNLLMRNLVLEMDSLERAVKPEDRFPRRILLFLRLVELLPSWIWVPSRRLEQLVEQALRRQMVSCWQLESPAAISLFEDHICGQDCVTAPLPSRCKQILTKHGSEILFVQFSNNGEYLASSSRDGAVIIWKVSEDDTVSLERSLSCQEGPTSVMPVKWSSNDAKLLTCDKTCVRIWNTDAGKLEHKINISSDIDIIACTWGPDTENIFLAGCAPYSYIYAYSLDGDQPKGKRINMISEVSDLAVTPDKHLVCACKDDGIWFLSLDGVCEAKINLDYSITALSISKNGLFLIVSLNNEEIQEWSCTTLGLIQKHSGHKQGNEIIRPCFGGANCSYIASGSVDSKIYIWHTYHPQPICVLQDHTLAVNSVSWNPARPNMLASASSDGTVRIWVSRREQLHS